MKAGRIRSYSPAFHLFPNSSHWTEKASSVFFWEPKSTTELVSAPELLDLRGSREGKVALKRRLFHAMASYVVNETAGTQTRL